jgi:hypothetical protein
VWRGGSFDDAIVAGSKTLTFKTDDANYSISFDSAGIPEHEMRDLIILSPVVTNYAGIPQGRFSLAPSTPVPR